MVFVELSQLLRLYLCIETILIILLYFRSAAILIESGRYYIVTITACLSSFSLYNNIYMLLGNPFLGGFKVNGYSDSQILSFSVLSTILTLYLELRIINCAHKSIRTPNSLKNGSINSSLSDPAKVPLSLLLVFIMYSIEVFKISGSNPSATSFLTGGDYINSSSGLSEYIAPLMAIYIVKLNNRPRNIIEKIIYCLLFLFSSYNFLLGMRASASVVMLFLLFVLCESLLIRRTSNFARPSPFLNPYIYGAFLLFLIAGNTFVGSFRLSSSYHGSLMPPINQFTETLNSSIGFLNLPSADLGKIFSSNPLEFAYGLISLSLPQQFFGYEAAKNIVLPYNELTALGIQSGGGGLIYSWSLYVFGPALGLIVLGILFEALAKRSLPLSVEITLSILAVRVCFYDPLSVALRTITIGFAIYIIAKTFLIEEKRA